MHALIFGFNLLVSVSVLTLSDFKSEQLKNSRVKAAYQEKEGSAQSLLENHGIKINTIEIFIRAFKKEKVLELWGKNQADEKFKVIKRYDFCESSGELGPKRRQGDWQIPEGFYTIDRFNPWSKFHLSLGINYPNRSDRILADKQDPGGDIFIHGNCVTIGCIPITDDKIKELYLFAVEAKNNGQDRIPVHIFPGRLGREEFEKLREEYAKDKELIDFWTNLEEGYTYFEKSRVLPQITVSKDGAYEFN